MLFLHDVSGPQVEVLLHGLKTNFEKLGCKDNGFDNCIHIIVLMMVLFMLQILIIVTLQF